MHMSKQPSYWIATMCSVIISPAQKLTANDCRLRTPFRLPTSHHHAVSRTCLPSLLCQLQRAFQHIPFWVPARLAEAGAEQAGRQVRCRGQQRLPHKGGGHSAAASVVRGGERKPLLGQRVAGSATSAHAQQGERAAQAPVVAVGAL